MNVLDPVTQIARVAHEANRAYCDTMGDHTQLPWDVAPQWQQSSARSGVEGIIRGDITSPGDSHRSWFAEKEREGWVYGEEKSAKAKTHPCMVPFDHLPPEQQAKDYLFFAVATALIQASRGSF